MHVSTAEREMEDAGWRGRVGWIQPPRGTLDPFEFMQIAPPGLRVIPTITYMSVLSGDGLDTDAVYGLAEQVEQASVILKEAGADILTQSGSPFSFLAGGYAGGLATQTRIEEKVGLPFVMMGLAMLNAAREFGYARVAVAATSYSEEWQGAFQQFLQDGGIEVVGIENWVQQGIFSSYEEVQRASHPQHSKVTVGMSYRAGRTVMRKHPDADCLFMLGGAIVVLDIIEALEQDLGVPIVTAPGAQFWEVLKRLGIGAPIRGYGSLLASLEQKDRRRSAEL